MICCNYTGVPPYLRMIFLQPHLPFLYLIMWEICKHFNTLANILPIKANTAKLTFCMTKTQPQSGLMNLMVRIGVIPAAQSLLIHYMILPEWKFKLSSAAMELLPITLIVGIFIM